MSRFRGMNPPVIYDTKKVNYNIGLAIAKARRKKGYTLMEVYDRGGPCSASLSSYEKGRYSEIRLEFVLKVCNALGIKIEDLIKMCHEDNFAWVEDEDE